MRKLGPEELGNCPKVTQQIRLHSGLECPSPGLLWEMLDIVAVALKGSGFPPTREAWPVSSYSLIPCSLISGAGPPPIDFLSP